jgi:medium-chain acyl-[acyl-carrier-protein] hydrolase
MEPSDPTWFWPARAVAQPRARLFCFPYAGANATVFRTWPSHLPPDVEVIAAQLPGRGPRLRERPIARIEPLVQAIGAALRPSANRVPFVMFGHSMGALVAFGICRWLRARGWPMPAHLFLAARRAPHLLDSYPPVGEMTDEYILARVRRYGGTPPQVFAHPELMELLMPVFRADFGLLAANRYVPEAPLDVPVTVLGGAADDDAQPSLLEAWRDHTKGPFSRRSFEGDHFFIHSAEAAVLKVLHEVLARV